MTTVKNTYVEVPNDLKTVVTQKETVMEQHAELFSLLVSNVREYAIFILDTEGHIASWNGGAENLFGYTESEIFGKDFSMLFVDEDTNVGRPARELRVAEDQGKMEDENWLVRNDGSKFWASGVTTALFDTEGALRGYVKIVRDLTDRVLAEKKKNEFMSMASHELKTPATSLKMYTYVLGERLKDSKDAEALQLLGKIEAQVNRLVSRVSDLLDVTKVINGKLKLSKETFSMAELVQEVVEDMQSIAAPHRIEVEAESDGAVFADRERIAQVLINLISNAIKFSADSEKINISVCTDEAGVVVGVQDFGVGVPSDKWDAIFQPFFQLENESVSAADTGLGLGLHVSSDIVERHSGRIWVESVEGQGSIFYFALPIK